MSDDPLRGLRWGVLATAMLALAWGLSLGVRPLLAFGLAMLGTLVVLWAYPWLAIRGVELERRLSPRASEEDEVLCTFALQNRTGLPLLAPQVEDHFGPDRVPRRRAVVYPTLPGRSLSRVGYRGRCSTRRGVHPVGPAQVRVSCPTGLFAAERGDLLPDRILVYPRLERLPELIGGGSGRPLVWGQRALRAPGDGEVALGVRDYRAGDPLRRIHWPTSARRGRLALVEPERPVSRSVAVFLDLRRDSLRGLGRQSTLEVSVRIAASAAAHYLLRGDRVSLRAQGREPVNVPTGGGSGQLAAILDVLARVRPDGDATLPALIELALRQLGPGQAAFLIVADPNQEPERLLEATLCLRARRAEVVAVLLDPVTFPDLFGAASATPPPLARLAEALLAAGARVHTVGCGDALPERFLRPSAGRERLVLGKLDRS